LFVEPLELAAIGVNCEHSPHLGSVPMTFDKIILDFTSNRLFQTEIFENHSVIHFRTKSQADDTRFFTQGQADKT
jgi:hypothetical protein